MTESNGQTFYGKPKYSLLQENHTSRHEPIEVKCVSYANVSAVSRSTAKLEVSSSTSMLNMLVSGRIIAQGVFQCYKHVSNRSLGNLCMFDPGDLSVGKDASKLERIKE